MKSSIEYEITEIDKRYEKVDKETTKSYEIKRENLIKEEKELKEKLKNEVTKIKEQFEINLSMIKTLSYVSKINKNKKEMGILFQQLMKNLKISFIKNENAIKYEEYFFNGIPIPKDVEFADIDSYSFKVLWKIDDINIINIDKKEIKYKLEIRKENSNEDFIKIYEGNENNFIINKNLDKNTNYEIRICSIYKDIISFWTDIYKIKTKNLDSLILKESERENEFLEKLYEWTGYKNMELLYRGTKDGDGSNIFHNKCDNQGPTICLFKNEKGNIFGAYSSISWTSDNKYHSSKGSFLFTLTNIYGTTLTKFPNTQYYENAVYHKSNYGPTFGGNHDLYICNNYLTNSSGAYLGNSFPDILGKGDSVFSGNTNTGNFKLKELEVFKLI